MFVAASAISMNLMNSFLISVNMDWSLETWRSERGVWEMSLQLRLFVLMGFFFRHYLFIFSEK